MRVVFLTTSYPRHDGDFAGRFISPTRSSALRSWQVTRSPPGRDFRDDSGSAYGVGHDARRRPWAVPPLLPR